MIHISKLRLRNSLFQENSHPDPKINNMLTFLNLKFFSFLSVSSSVNYLYIYIYIYICMYTHAEPSSGFVKIFIHIIQLLLIKNRVILVILS